MNAFSAKDRDLIKQKLSAEVFDLLIIGGGITGAGIALDAAARGLKVALVDMQDFAAGTSSRSTKLIHGGLRYLKQMEFALVAEVGGEREIIHRIAPQLTIPEPMLLPIIKKGSFGRLTISLAMFVYEMLARVKKSETHKFLNQSKTLEKEPLLQKENLLGSVLFYEYRTDDARLTIEVLKEAATRGAVALNYTKVIGFTYNKAIVDGANVEDSIDGKKYTIKSNYVINASGPWVDELDSLDKIENGDKLTITKGVHLVVDRKKLPVKQAMYFDTFDKRMLFVIPRDEKVYIGTTDTFYKNDKTHPQISKEDCEYILKCLNIFFPAHQLKALDFESSWVGLRPLIKKKGKKPSEISRKDEVFVWDSGLISIAGGKLTGYRKMAERVLDVLSKKILSDQNKTIPKSSTQSITISGGKIPAGMSFIDFTKTKINEAIQLGLKERDVRQLVNRYGSNIDFIFENLKSLRINKTDNGLPELLEAQILYTIEHEMCLTPSDFFVRRTGLLYFDIDQVKKNKLVVIGYLNKFFSWDNTLNEKLTNDLDNEINEAGLSSIFDPQPVDSKP